MEVCPFQGREKKIPDLLCDSVTGYKKSVWMNERGDILIPVIIFTSIAILAVTIAISMIPSHQKEALFIQQKLSRDILEYGITQIVKIPKNCACLLTGQTIDKALNKPPSLVLPDIKKGGCGSDVLISDSHPQNNVGYGMKVDSIEVNDLDGAGMTDTYIGVLTISYDTNSLFRSIKPLNIPLEITVDGGPGVQPISSCQFIVADVSNQKKGDCRGSQVGSLHDNGGGFVSGTARVAPSAYVGRNASVCDNAQVLGSAKIKDYAKVTDYSIVSGNAIISGKAKIERDSEVTGRAQVSGQAVVSHKSKVSEDVQISGNTEVINSIVSDWAIISKKARIINSTVSGKSTVTDEGIVDGGSVINGGSTSDASWSVTVNEYSRVTRGATVSGDAQVSGGAVISNGITITTGTHTQ